MSEPYTMAAGMQGFQCLGSECEDTCCHDWDIRVDMVRYESLSSLMAADPGEAALFQSAFQMVDDPSARRYAHIRLLPNGCCPLLEESGWCRIHREYGESVLPETCALFPRVLSRTREGVEMTGALSCPEVARRSLLGPEANGDWLPMVPETLPTGTNHAVSRQLGNSCYERSMPTIRAHMLARLPTTGAGLDGELLAMAYLTARIAPFYHAGCSDPGADLERALERWQHVDIRASLQKRLARPMTEGEEPMGMMIIQAMLGLRINRFPEELLSADAGGLFEDLRRAGVSFGEGGFVPGELASVYRERRARVRAGLGLQVDTLLSRWVRNTLQREWFTSMPDPFAYFQMILIRMACLRFLLYTDPDMLKAARNRDREAADAQMVRWVYRFARSVDHNLSFLEAIYYAAVEQGLMNLEASPGLIRP